MEQSIAGTEGSSSDSVQKFINAHLNDGRTTRKSESVDFSFKQNIIPGAAPPRTGTEATGVKWTVDQAVGFYLSAHDNNLEEGDLCVNDIEFVFPERTYRYSAYSAYETSSSNPAPE